MDPTGFIRESVQYLFSQLSQLARSATRDTWGLLLVDGCMLGALGGAWFPSGLSPRRCSRWARLAGFLLRRRCHPLVIGGMRRAGVIVHSVRCDAWAVFFGDAVDRPSPRKIVITVEMVNSDTLDLANDRLL